MCFHLFSWLAKKSVWIHDATFSQSSLSCICVSNLSESLLWMRHEQNSAVTEAFYSSFFLNLCFVRNKINFPVAGVLTTNLIQGITDHDCSVYITFNLFYYVDHCTPFNLRTMLLKNVF